jgi:hypothetical protein
MYPQWEFKRCLRQYKILDFIAPNSQRLDGIFVKSREFYFGRRGVSATATATATATTHPMVFGLQFTPKGFAISTEVWQL